MEKYFDSHLFLFDHTRMNINQQGFQKRFKFIITERSNKCYRADTVKEVREGRKLPTSMVIYINRAIK